MAAIKMGTAAYLLGQWGLWSRSSGLRLGYTSPLLRILNDNVEQSHGPRLSCLISDELAALVDAAVCELGRGQVLVARALWLHYVRGQTTVDMAEALGCTRQMAAQLRDHGVMWVDGWFARGEAGAA